MQNRLYQSLNINKSNDQCCNLHQCNYVTIHFNITTTVVCAVQRQ